MPTDKSIRAEPIARPRCVHGLDARFCSICNRLRSDARIDLRRRAAGDASLEQIIQFLDEHQVRATYAAVAGVLGLKPRSISVLLGPRRVEASWIVNAADGLPTDYSQDEMHPALLHKSEIITTSVELSLRMSAWKAARGD